HDNACGVEIFKYGISRAFFDEGDIAVIKTEGDMSRDAINTWASLLILTMQEWDTSRPLLALHDLSHPNQGITPYTRQRAVDLMNYRPDGLKIYSALLLPNTFMSRILEMFIRTPRLQSANHHLKVFNCIDEALVWLRQHKA
ncbi:MAG: hypothetical protein AAFN11_16305, partial [Chloroflexota bacterium]